MICVNALYRAFSISTHINNSLTFDEMLVSMPFIGLSPFLLCAFLKVQPGDIMCQCPLSGFLHFYSDSKEDLELAEQCQCPLSGFLHFYGDELMTFKVKTESVNALYRAFSISTLVRLWMQVHLFLCQCPLSGFLHFYAGKISMAEASACMCQCPLSGFLHFYAPLWERPKMKHLQTRFCR